MLKVLSFVVFISGAYSAFANQFVEPQDGVDLNDASFPWQLVLDRGKILGCIYNNRFYSLGSILVLESLPRKMWPSV